MAAAAEILRGCIGLVDPRHAGWEQRAAECRQAFNALVVPGYAELFWDPAVQTVDVAGLVSAAAPLPVLAPAAGVWKPAGEGEKDTLSYLTYLNETVERTREAAAAGAAMVAAPTPLGLQPLAGQAAQALCYRYFRDVQAKCPLPVVIFQPEKTPAEYRLEPESVLSLVRMGKVAGMVMMDGSPEEVEAIVRYSRKADFALVCSEGMVPWALEAGAAGVAVDLESPRAVEIAALLRERAA